MEQKNAYARFCDTFYITYTTILKWIVRIDNIIKEVVLVRGKDFLTTHIKYPWLEVGKSRKPKLFP
jgi:hypothetical protein